MARALGKGEGMNAPVPAWATAWMESSGDPLRFATACSVSDARRAGERGR